MAASSISDSNVVELSPRRAQRNLDLLGRVNPLALEEFEAMSERHRFLAEQYYQEGYDYRRAT